MISRRVFLLPGLLSCVPLAGCIVAGADSGWVTQRDEKRFSVEANPEVVLATYDGPIEIQSWDRPEVLVVIERRAAGAAATAAIDVQSGQQGNRVSVEVKPAPALGWSWFGHGSARLIVSVPQSANVRASSGDGAIRISHVNGTIALRSGDGRIQASNNSGSVSASTGDGGIELDGVDGAVEATTGDGRVRVSGKLTALRARSGDGSIAVQALPGQLARHRLGHHERRRRRHPAASRRLQRQSRRAHGGRPHPPGRRQRHEFGRHQPEQRPRPAGCGRPFRARADRRRLDHPAAPAVVRTADC